MMCAWKQLLSVLPPRLRPEVDRLGKNALQELRLLATAHGTSAADLRRRSVYRPLAESGVFQTLLILRQDKSFRAERAAL